MLTVKERQTLGDVAQCGIELFPPPLQFGIGTTQRSRLIPLRKGQPSVHSDEHQCVQQQHQRKAHHNHRENRALDAWNHTDGGIELKNR